MNLEPFEPFKEASENPVLFKTQINSLLESYNGQWDVLVELIQNAVDAIELRFKSVTDFTITKPIIEIDINIQTEILRISDNGIGINEQSVKKVLAPNFTTKQFNSSLTFLQRGHKGVGLSYVAYFTNLFRIYTKTDIFEFSAELYNGKDWAIDKNSELNPPSVYPSYKFQPEFFKKHNRGSSFELKVELLGSKNLISWLGWIQVLRTQTALAFCSITPNITNSDYPEWVKNLEIQLNIIDKDGNKLLPKHKNEAKLLQFDYFYPHQYFEPSCNLRGLYEKSKSSNEPIPTSEENKYLALWNTWDYNQLLGLINSEKNYADLLEFAIKYKPKVYAFFVSSQTIWENDIEDFSTDKRRKFWWTGIHLVTENMPVGRPIPIDLTFESGNNERTIIIIECTGLRPDYGRKGFGDFVYTFSRVVAKNAIKSFIKNRKYLKPSSRANPWGSGGSSGDPEDDAEQAIENAKSLQNLQIVTPYLKNPDNEQGVIGLFCVLLGMKKILGYQIYSLSSNAQYDAIVGFSLKKEVDKATYSDYNKLGILSTNFKKGEIKKFAKNLEFKYKLSDLVKQFNPNEPSSKQIELIQWVVAWEIGDLKVFEKKGMNLEDITQKDEILKREFHSVTHLLYLPNGTKKIHVIVLKKVIELFVSE